MTHPVKKIKISISIVIHKPDISVLEKVFIQLKKAIDHVNNKYPSIFDIYIIDNSVDNPNENKSHSLLNVIFSNSENIICHFIKPKKNIGYGAGNNLAIQQVISDYHLVLNPDVFVEEDTLLQAIKYMDKHSEIGLLTPAVFGENGKRHYLCKNNPTLFDLYLRSFAPNFIKKKFRLRMMNFEMRYKDYGHEILDIPAPTGCFMFFRTSVLKKLEGFDEKFFMYFEDSDIGRRILKISHSAYVPKVKIIHKWARGSHNNLKLKLVTICSALIYWRKWGGIY